MRDTCPVCEKPAKCEISTGDGTFVECARCGPYNISGTALELLENETLERPDPKEFKALVEKRGDSDKYPWITEDDLRSIIKLIPGYRVRVWEEPDTGGLTRLEGDSWTRPPGDSWTREPYMIEYG